MRVVGGKWRGRALEAPSGKGTTRPTTDRTRESIASMVLSESGLDLTGATVLDAFAGSGAIGIELVSRGAACATLVDRSRVAVACMRRNLSGLGAAGHEFHIVCADVRKAAEAGLAGAPFSVVVLDPPYAMAADAVTSLVARLASTGQLASTAIVVYERDASAVGIDVNRIPGASTIRGKRHGTTACDLVRVELGGSMDVRTSVAARERTARPTHRSTEAVTHVVVPGTFDPLTYGHLDVIMRAARLFSQVTVAVAASAGKNGVGTVFTLDERVCLVRDALADAGLEGVSVVPFTGLLMDLCVGIGATGVVKGLRAMTDFEYELQQADLNRRLGPDVESVFVMSSPEYGYVSSSIVRELASLGSDVSFLVPPCVERALGLRFSSRQPLSDGPV